MEWFAFYPLVINFVLLINFYSVSEYTLWIKTLVSRDVDVVKLEHGCPKGQQCVSDCPYITNAEKLLSPNDFQTIIRRRSCLSTAVLGRKYCCEVDEGVLFTKYMET